MTANAQAMEALTGGAEGLEFEFGSVPDWATFEQALAGVHLDFIGLHFSGQGAGQKAAHAAVADQAFQRVVPQRRGGCRHNSGPSDCQRE